MIGQCKLRRQRSMAAPRRFALLLAIALSAWAPSLLAQPPVFSESEIKATFLFHFANFTAWRAGAFQTRDDPIVYCTRGEGPVGETLARIIVGEKVKGHPLRRKRIDKSMNMSGCHILYIEGASSVDGTLLERAQDAGVLTVGTSDDFAERGGMITLRIDRGRVRPAVNLRSVHRSGLQLSSKLLRLAEVIDE